MILHYMNGMAPGYLANRFVKRFSISGRQTRSSQLLDIPPLKTTVERSALFLLPSSQALERPKR